MTPRLTGREFGVGGRVAAGWTLGCFGESVGVWNHFGRAVGVQQLVDKAEDRQDWQRLCHSVLCPFELAVF